MLRCPPSFCFCPTRCFSQSLSRPSGEIIDSPNTIVNPSCPCREPDRSRLLFRKNLLDVCIQGCLLVPRSFLSTFACLLGSVAVSLDYRRPHPPPPPSAPLSPPASSLDAPQPSPSDIFQPYYLQHSRFRSINRVGKQHPAPLRDCACLVVYSHRVC